MPCLCGVLLSLEKVKIILNCLSDDLCDCLIMRQANTECGDFGRDDGDEEEGVRFHMVSTSFK